MRCRKMTKHPTFVAGANPHQISDTDDNGGDVNTNISPRPSAHDEAAAAAVSGMCTSYVGLTEQITRFGFLTQPRAGSYICPTDAANFRQRLRLWVLKIAVLLLNFPRIGGFRPRISQFSLY